MSNDTLSKKLLTSRFGKIKADSIDDYVSTGGYSVLKKVLSMTGDDIISEIKTSGLKGRGGAGFPSLK